MVPMIYKKLILADNPVVVVVVVAVKVYLKDSSANNDQWQMWHLQPLIWQYGIG